MIPSVRRACSTSPRSASCSPRTRPTLRIADPKGFARRWHILMKGSIVAAGEGDAEAALRARQIGALVLEHEPRTG